MPDSAVAYRAAPYSYAEALALQEQLGLSEPVAITLVRRGYRTPEQARAFLAADEQHPAAAFGSMAVAVETVLAAVDAGARITVHGDFDVDGVCATAILVGALRRLGAECDWLIPDRLSEGYGLRAENVERLARRGTELLITVDCGVTAVEEVALAQSLGIEVIVTDHHQAGEALPGCTILHPALDGYPFSSLCGAAVAWKLVCALWEGSGMGSPGSLSRGVPGDPIPDPSPATEPSRDLDLVALATVADVVPLVGENRSLVRRGLAEARRARRPGMRALLEAAKCEPSSLDEGDLSFRLAPRINAAGRLYRADAGVELFLTEDEGRAAEIAAELGRANSERRAAEREVDAAAESAWRAQPEQLRAAPAIVVAGEGWHPGVIGIVASRLVERHHRPAVVISLDGEGGGRGSGRSIPGFDLLAGLDACGGHLERFGGHRAAAGLELRAENLEGFRAAFAAHATATLGDEDLRRTERIDAAVGGAGLGLELAEELERLAPFGMGNPGVRLIVPAARVRYVRALGDEGKHSRFSLHSGAHRALGVAFGRGSLGVGEGELLDAAVRLEVNRWNGSVEPRVVLRELYRREAGAEGAQADRAWWAQFEHELQAPLPTGRFPAYMSGNRPVGAERRVLRPRSSPAAVVAELASSGEGEVLAVVACVERRAPLAAPGVELVDPARLEAEPELARGFRHVVVVDPLPAEGLEAIAVAAHGEGGYAHFAWGDAEYLFALSVLDETWARRDPLASLFRDLRDAGELSGPELLAALRGAGPHPRPAADAARAVRVLTELGLLRGEPSADGGSLGVVSSEGTDLERSPAYRAYGARHAEAKRYLERRRQP